MLKRIAFNLEVRVDMEIMDKILSKIKVNESNNCWIWQGATQKGRDTRPTMNFNKKRWYVYRVVYSLKIGVIPKDMLICHKCDNGMCINPDHLFLGTYKDNAQDSLNKGRHSTQLKPEVYKEIGRNIHLKRKKLIRPEGKLIKMESSSNLGVFNRNKTHCPKGHPYNEGNTRVNSKQRKCRTCANEWAKISYKKQALKESEPT